LAPFGFALMVAAPLNSLLFPSFLLTTGTDH
jgi:hypothetical protein